jgi:hypothetical protein
MEMMQEKAVKRKAPSTAQDDAAGATPAEPSTSQHPAADDEGHLTEIADDSVEKELMDVDWQARPLLQYTVTRTQSVMWLVVVMLRVVNAMRPYVHVQAHPAETIVAEAYHAKVLILLCACMQTCAGDNFYSACMLELSRRILIVMLLAVHCSIWSSGRVWTSLLAAWLMQKQPSDSG